MKLRVDLRRIDKLLEQLSGTSSSEGSLNDEQRAWLVAFRNRRRDHSSQFDSPVAAYEASLDEVTEDIRSDIAEALGYPVILLDDSVQVAQEKYLQMLKS